VEIHRRCLFQSRGTDVDFAMARTAKGNEILSHILSQLAARPDMMNLKFLGNSASLTPPSIALEHLLAEHPIDIPI
jgi:hypothetical protein